MSATEAATALIEGDSMLARVEALLRQRGPTSADRTAALLRCRRSTVLEALERHPLAFHNGSPRRASRWAVARVRTHSTREPRKPGSEYIAVQFSEAERARTPVKGGVPVVCPACGSTHVVTGGRARKVARGLRSTRCSSCVAEAHLLSERRPLTATEWLRQARWWLTNYTDEEIARTALMLGIETASAANVARRRAHLLPGPAADGLLNGLPRPADEPTEQRVPGTRRVRRRERVG